MNRGTLARTLIYSFTGTGNSLWAADIIAWRLGDAVVRPITRRTIGASVPEGVERLGLVFPLQWWGMPALVADFVNGLDLASVRYVFAVVTRGGSPGCAMGQLRALLRRRGGHLDAFSYVRMPGNYVAEYDMRSRYRQNGLFRRAEKKLLRIAANVAQETGRRRELPIGRWIARLVNARWRRTVHDQDRHFYADDRCVSCGTCVRLCPVGDIRLVAGRPEWLGHCEQCFACLHHCPTHAIQFGTKTIRRRRYIHPEVPTHMLERRTKAEE
jgi:NAD-dependent dihydropyrimidine dehydrogenase PreA subunit